MDQEMSSNTSVPEMLLKTNRPPTEQERTTILDSMALTNAKLKDVEGKISEQIAYIEVSQSQVEQAKIRLDRLREERAAILGTFADHHRVFSPFRNLPEDVLREICVACVWCPIPELVYGHTSIPDTLGQICRGMRHVALTTPIIWAAVSVNIKPISYMSIRLCRQAHATLARKAVEWFKRAGVLALTVEIKDFTGSTYSMFNNDSDSDPRSILFDALLSFSTRWKEFTFSSTCQDFHKPMVRIASLTAADVPLLQSVSLHFGDPDLNAVFRDSQLLRIPTLRHVTLINAVQMFHVNWAVLTSITVESDTDNQIGSILQQTKCLEFCTIVVHRSDERYTHTINLPFLKTLIVTTRIDDMQPSEAHSILEAITAPILEIFEHYIEYSDLSLAAFLQRSPHIWKFTLAYLDADTIFTLTIEFLRHCPSLTVLSLTPHGFKLRCFADRVLRAFVEGGNDGVICPRLQDLSFGGNIEFSVQTLRIFFEGKQGDIESSNIFPWKKVVIEVTGIESSGECRQIEDLISTKHAAGLDVRVYSRTRSTPY